MVDPCRGVVCPADSRGPDRQQGFWDEEYGEWYAVLHRDGKPRIMDKGGLQKSAFHVPRALYNCCLLLQGKPIFGKGGEV